MVPLQIQIRLALAVVRPRTRHCPEQRRGLEHPRYVGLRTHTHPAPLCPQRAPPRVFVSHPPWRIRHGAFSRWFSLALDAGGGRLACCARMMLVLAGRCRPPPVRGRGVQSGGACGDARSGRYERMNAHRDVPKTKSTTSARSTPCCARAACRKVGSLQRQPAARRRKHCEAACGRTHRHHPRQHVGLRPVLRSRGGRLGGGNGERQQGV